MGSSASLDSSPRKNWVENSGGLPPYVREIARSVHEKRGVPLSRAISIAIGVLKRWAAGGGDVTEKTRAKAAKAVAQWEALKVKNKGRRAASAVAASHLALAAGSKTPPFRDSKSGTTTVSKTDADDPRVKAMADKLTAKGYDRERAYKVATAIIRRRKGAKSGKTSTAAAHAPATGLALAAEPAGANGDRKTGGMIALIPSAADLERLTADHANAEAPADLHVTLNYIGPDVTGWDQQRTDDLLATARRVAEHLGGPITARAWAHASFNPDGGPDGDRDPCAVYLIGQATTPRGERDRARYEADAERDGVPRPIWHHYDPIADAHSDLKYAVPGVVGAGAAQQHQPFVPHLTGGYGMTADDLTYTGPITFDRIAVHLAGERHEFPLIDGREDEEEARLNPIPMRAAHPGGRRLALGQGPSCKCGGPHQLVFYANRSTPAVVHPGDDAPQQKGYGKVTGRRKATAAQEKQIAKGEWIRVDQSGNKPGDSSYAKSKLRPALSGAQEDTVDRLALSGPHRPGQRFKHGWIPITPEDNKKLPDGFHAKVRGADTAKLKAADATLHEKNGDTLSPGHKVIKNELTRRQKASARPGAPGEKEAAVRRAGGSHTKTPYEAIAENDPQARQIHLKRMTPAQLDSAERAAKQRGASSGQLVLDLVATERKRRRTAAAQPAGGGLALAAGTDTPAVRNPAVRSISVSDSGSGPKTTTNSTGKAPSGLAPAMKAAGKATSSDDKVEKAAQALIAKGWSRDKAYSAARKLVAGQTSKSAPAKTS